MMRFLFVAIVFVVMVSGCPDSGFSGASFAMGNGMQINSFEFKPAKLVSGQATLLKLDIQNMGSLNVEDVYVNFYGLSNGWEGETIGDFSVDFNDRVVEIPEGLRSANAEFKTEGQKQVIVWRLTSPEEHLYGTEFTHRAYARVCYPYVTNVVATVEVVGEDEWLVMEQSGKFSEHPISVKQTAAPIQVHIESMQPIIVDNSMSMELKISNVGGGVAFVGADDGGLSCRDMFDSSEVDVAIDLNNVRIEGLEDVDCRVLGEARGDVWLSRGQERTISVKCDGFSSDMPKQEFNLNIKFRYNYYIDAETSVVLEGVEGEAVGGDGDGGEDDDEEEENRCVHTISGRIIVAERPDCDISGRLNVEIDGVLTYVITFDNVMATVDYRESSKSDLEVYYGASDKVVGTCRTDDGERVDYVIRSAIDLADPDDKKCGIDWSFDAVHVD